MIKISVAIITFNEEKNIARCIKSVMPLADEILVVDSYSTDKTKEICASFGVRFIEHGFEGHIEQKNFAMSQCSHDYILSLDADEALSEALRELIIEKRANWDKDAFWMKRITNYCGKWIKHCGWYPDKKIRLFDRRMASWGGQNPHDAIVLNSDAQVGYLDADLLHYSYYTIKQHINQINYFTDIGSVTAYKRGKRATLLTIIFGPIIKFLKGYILQSGWLDGYYGFVVCLLSAHATFLKYIKLKELNDSGNDFKK